MFILLTHLMYDPVKCPETPVPCVPLGTEVSVVAVVAIVIVVSVVAGVCVVVVVAVVGVVIVVSVVSVANPDLHIRGRGGGGGVIQTLR